MQLERVICEKRTYSKQFDTHDHPYGQLLFPLQGAMEIKMQEQDFQLTDKFFFYLPPGCEHTFRAMDSNEFLIVDLPAHLLVGEQSQPYGQYMKLDEQWRSIRYLLLDDLVKRGTSSSALTYLGRYISEKLQKQTERSIQHIHDHFAEKITIEELSELEHYHPTYYTNWFKKVTGMSPGAYIQKVRLMEAKRLLVQTSIPITTISSEVGFDYPSSFTRSFIRVEGVSPQMYRKTYKKDK
ncbi:AraC family transcriptional regulator [Alkalihalobacillus sp. MEB130]|uniref:helix-turn-helix transcriptional regulator n=1 Tax=Alkalihalobacillus sp. MEB130 TaxID=2976704 RepID=UPI0028DED09E|nr:AraC family transcriptional regulator [Alkalihalobacillus sp. MEB130]MDT8861606.1 AraC family transcriptional regulator [Alkalihalobacillus sp. MEB130]